MTVINAAFRGTLEMQNPISGQLRVPKTCVNTLTDVEAQVDSSDILQVGTTPITIKLPDVEIDTASLKNIGAQPILVSFVPSANVGGSDPFIITLQPGGVIAFAGLQ